MSEQRTTASAIKKIGIATVGSSMEPILRGYNYYSVDQLVLLYSERTIEVAQKIKQRIDDVAISRVCELVRVNPFDFQEILLKIVLIKKKNITAEIIVNITGGTNIMCSAALLACFTIGARAFYVKEDVEKKGGRLSEFIVDIPVPKVSFDSLHPSQQKILKILQDRGGRLPTANKELSEALERTPGNLSYLLRNLKKKGLIELEIQGRKKEAILTNAGRLFAELL